MQEHIDIPFSFPSLSVLADLMEASRELKQKGKHDGEDILRDRFRDRIAVNGLQIIDNAGDGNCLFEAVSHQLLRHNIHYTPSQLRELAVDTLWQNPQTVIFWLAACYCFFPFCMSSQNCMFY